MRSTSSMTASAVVGGLVLLCVPVVVRAQGAPQIRAITHVAGRYSRQAMCARTIEVYEELLFPEAGALREPAPAAVVA